MGVAATTAQVNEYVFRCMSIWISGFLERVFYRMHSAIRNDIVYCNHCMRHCLQGFWTSLQLGPDGLAIWFDFEFNSTTYVFLMRWSGQFTFVVIPDKLISIFAHLFLHGQCNVDGCLGKRGYESTPVCAKPSYWMRRDDGEFIHEFTWKWTAFIE